MARDSAATRQRLLDAATDEFARYGIAGARVDRIAEAADSNKAQIYHYFDSKDGLFDAVFNAQCVQTVTEVPIDVTDLAEYAGRLFDSYEARPHIQRLATWYRLERGDSAELLGPIQASMKDKLAKIDQAQRAGDLPTRFAAVDLLTLVIQLSGLWSSLTPEHGALLTRHSRAHRRRVVVDAVSALLV